MSKIFAESRVIETDHEYQQDCQLIELQKKLNNLASERKKAESQISCMENRLKLLKGEEVKALKKVGLTKNLTIQRTNILERLEASVNFKQKQQEVKQKNENYVKLKNKKFIEEKRMKTLENKDRFKKKIQFDLNSRKEIRNTHNSILIDNKKNSVNMNKSKSDIIRAFRMASKANREISYSEKKNKLKNTFTSKYGREYKLNDEAQKTFQKLVDEEQIMISKIKTTTNVYKMSKFII